MNFGWHFNRSMGEPVRIGHSAKNSLLQLPITDIYVTYVVSAK